MQKARSGVSRSAPLTDFKVPPSTSSWTRRKRSLGAIDVAFFVAGGIAVVPAVIPLRLFELLEQEALPLLRSEEDLPAKPTFLSAL